MRPMRRGSLLIEMVVVIGIAAVLFTVFTPMIPDLLREMSAARRAADAQRQIADVLEKMQADMDRCVDLPVAAGAREAGEHTLLLATPEGAVAYDWADGNMVRSGPGGAADARAWCIPSGVFRWQVLRENGARSLVVRTAVVVRVSNRQIERLAGARVFSVGGLGQPAPRPEGAAVGLAAGEERP
jgi:type II secretory pathway pseudopilin PulG